MLTAKLDMFSSKFISLSVILSHLYEPNNIDHIDQWYTTKSCSTLPVNTLRPRQNGRHFPDDFFKRISLNEIVWISIKISLNFVPRVPINNIPALVQIMACRWPGDKPLSEPMMVSLLTHLCVARPQGVKNSWWYHAVVRVDSESTKINSNQSNYIEFHHSTTQLYKWWDTPAPKGCSTIFGVNYFCWTTLIKIDRVVFPRH